MSHLKNEWHATEKVPHEVAITQTVKCQVSRAIRRLGALANTHAHKLLFKRIDRVRARVGQYPYSLANAHTHWQMFKTHLKIFKRIGFRATKVFDHLSNSSDDIHWRSFFAAKKWAGGVNLLF